MRAYEGEGWLTDDELLGEDSWSGCQFIWWGFKENIGVPLGGMGG